MSARSRIVTIALTLMLTACGTGAPSATGSLDMLGAIVARGTLIGYAELDYPPQSIAVEGAERLEGSRCAADQLTAAEVTGYDIEVTKLVARALGVEPCFRHVPFTTVTSGSWGGLLDIAFASASINADRMERFWMTQPYYAVPNLWFVATGSAYETASDLDGRRIGACAGCSHELFLRAELSIPGVDVELTVADPQIVTYDVESSGLEAVADGDLDAFLAAEPVGLSLIEEGQGLRPLPEVAFVYYPSGLVDKQTSLASASFIARVNEIIRSAHADGTLLALSERWFGTDYVRLAAAFDLDAIGQELP
jgi:polar amino acid transport system substrate-binding protein